jgi:hypothetical protein
MLDDCDNSVMLFMLGKNLKSLKKCAGEKERNIHSSKLCMKFSPYI